MLHPACSGTEIQLTSPQILSRDAGISFALCRKCSGILFGHQTYVYVFVTLGKRDDYWEDGSNLGC